MKISRNPTIAYQQGYKVGLAENIEYAYYADEIINEISFYNIIDSFVEAPETQIGLFKALIAERKRVKAEFAADEDNIAIAVRDINKIRRQFNEPLINWKT